MGHPVLSFFFILFSKKEVKHIVPFKKIDVHLEKGPFRQSDAAGRGPKQEMKSIPLPDQPTARRT